LVAGITTRGGHVIKAVDITLRVWFDDEVEVDGVPTGDIMDWNWNEIIYPTVPSVQFVSAINAVEQVKGI
jgi:hypothetical protein